MNVRGKVGGHNIVTSTSTYVHMGRFPLYLSGEIVYPKVNVHRDVSFQRPFFTKKTEIVGKSRGFRVVGGDETHRFSCTYFHVCMICMFFIERIGFYIHGLRVLFVWKRLNCKLFKFF